MKSCDFCERDNQYVCNPADHCGCCEKGRFNAPKETKEETIEDIQHRSNAVVG